MPKILFVEISSIFGNNVCSCTNTPDKCREVSGAFLILTLCTMFTMLKMLVYNLCNVNNFQNACKQCSQCSQCLLVNKHLRYVRVGRSVEHSLFLHCQLTMGSHHCILHHNLLCYLFREKYKIRYCNKPLSCDRF